MSWGQLERMIARFDTYIIVINAINRWIFIFFDRSAYFEFKLLNKFKQKFVIIQTRIHTSHLK